MKRRFPLVFGWLMVASLILSACGGAATPSAPKVASNGYVCPAPQFPAKLESTELNLYVWTEYIPAQILECFELTYGVTVNRYEYSSGEELYADVAAGGTDYDLIQPSDYMVTLMARQDMLQELDRAKLPVLKNFDPSYLNLEFDPGNKYSIPYLAGSAAIAVNRDRVAHPPKSWADLWDDEYAGRMVLLDDSRIVIGFTLLTLGYDVNTTDPAQLEEAKVRLKDLMPNIKLFDSDSPKTALAKGYVDLGVTWSAEALLARQENPAIDYIYPTEGAILWQDNWALLKNAPHADAAYAFLNYSMQGDVFWALLRDFPYTNPNQAALDYARENHKEIYDAYMASPAANIPPEVWENGFRIVDVGEASALYDDLWIEVMSGVQ